MKLRLWGNDHWDGYLFTFLAVGLCLINVLTENYWIYTDMPLAGQKTSDPVGKTALMFEDLLNSPIVWAAIGYFIDLARDASNRSTQYLKYKKEGGEIVPSMDGSEGQNLLVQSHPNTTLQKVSSRLFSFWQRSEEWQGYRATPIVIVANMAKIFKDYYWVFFTDTPLVGDKPNDENEAIHEFHKALFLVALFLIRGFAGAGMGLGIDYARNSYSNQRAIEDSDSEYVARRPGATLSSEL